MDQQTEIVELRKAVHSLAEALQPDLLKKIFAGTGAGFTSPEYQKFSTLVEDVLKKTS
jgi:hypothetical protein